LDFNSFALSTLIENFSFLLRESGSQSKDEVAISLCLLLVLATTEVAVASNWFSKAGK
jgi:hypothetical protein